MSAARSPAPRGAVRGLRRRKPCAQTPTNTHPQTHTHTHLYVPAEPGPSGLTALLRHGPGRADRGPARARRKGPCPGEQGPCPGSPPPPARPLSAPAEGGCGVSLQLGATSPHWGLATTIFGNTQRAPSARRNSVVVLGFFFFPCDWIKCFCFGSPQG